MNPRRLQRETIFSIKGFSFGSAIETERAVFVSTGPVSRSALPDLDKRIKLSRRLLSLLLRVQNRERFANSNALRFHASRFGNLRHDIVASLSTRGTLSV